jgi:hypothetical protein
MDIYFEGTAKIVRKTGLSTAADGIVRKVKQTFELNKRLINRFHRKYIITYITIIYKTALIKKKDLSYLYPINFD